MRAATVSLIRLAASAAVMATFIGAAVFVLARMP